MRVLPFEKEVCIYSWQLQSFKTRWNHWEIEAKHQRNTVCFYLPWHVTWKVQVTELLLQSTLLPKTMLGFYIYYLI